jgi:predicted dehydrogenase
MSRTTRRSFLKRTLAAAATVTIAGTKSAGRVRGANDAVRVAVAGLNGRGRDHVVEFAKLPGVQITYLIDPDRRVFAKPVKGKGDKETKGVVDYVEAKCGLRPKTVVDVRAALEDHNVDVLSIATPNHWHALMTIWACEAKKDGYVEKPCCHSLLEGHLATSYARKYNRIVQHGTQSRSNPAWHKVAAVIKSGKLGKLLVSRGLCYKLRPSIGRKEPEPVPAELDFNLWLGPAAERPFHKNLVHYNWHWFWDFGNGDIGNQGVHEMDIARWMIPGARFPKYAWSLGGRFGYQDQGETANTQLAFFDYGPTQLVFEVRGLPTDGYLGVKSPGNIFHLEEGTIVGTDKFIPKGKTQAEPLPDVGAEVKPAGGGHFANFLAAVKSRKATDLAADVFEGYYSSGLCHLANASYRVGQDVPFSAATKSFGDNKEAYETFARMEEHLRANGVLLDGQTYRLGHRLKYNVDLDNVTEPRAREILSGKYRKGFELPDKVL